MAVSVMQAQAQASAGASCRRQSRARRYKHLDAGTQEQMGACWQAQTSADRRWQVAAGAQAFGIAGRHVQQVTGSLTGMQAVRRGKAQACVGVGTGILPLAGRPVQLQALAGAGRRYRSQTQAHLGRRKHGRVGRLAQSEASSCASMLARQVQADPGRSRHSHLNKQVQSSSVRERRQRPVGGCKLAFACNQAQASHRCRLSGVVR